MSIDTPDVSTTVSFNEYKISVAFYPMESNYFNSVKEKLNSDQLSLVEDNFSSSNQLFRSLSLVRLVNPGFLANYDSDHFNSAIDKDVYCQIEVFNTAIDHFMDSPNDNNMRAIFSAIVTDMHARFVSDSVCSRMNSNLFENGIINKVGDPSHKSALYSVKSEHFGTYIYQPKPYAVCKYYTDNSSNIVSSEYQYANAARHATCSCPAMLSASPIKDSPLACLWKDHKDCIMYTPNSLLIKEDVVHPKADRSVLLHFKLVKEIMNDSSSLFKIYSDDKPVIVFDSDTSQMTVDQSLEVYQQYVDDIANDYVPVSLQLNQSNKSKFLSKLISE